ncbi:hypothetical protein EV07_0867 [Prochlorococcus sp. MIT 0603]|nr:hypothetical protein EV07_0867 [Prochlorococcus sp. MIT 0603]
MRRKTWAANFNDRPDSTIFLTKSSITPTDKDTTVKADIAKKKGGNNSLISHLSSNGINLHLDKIKFEIVFQKEKPKLYL